MMRHVDFGDNKTGFKRSRDNSNGTQHQSEHRKFYLGATFQDVTRLVWHDLQSARVQSQVQVAPIRF